MPVVPVMAVLPGRSASKRSLPSARRVAAGVLAAAAAAMPPGAWAHAGLFSGDSSSAPVWLAQVLWALAWIGYGSGALRVRPLLSRCLAFHAAMLIGGLALFGPFDRWAESSIAWHMVQHMLLIVVVAPLVVMARPWPQWRARAGRALDPTWRALMHLSRHPMACALLHALAIWFWHAPGPYMVAVFDTTWHVVEHACFLFTAWLFWGAVLRAGRAATFQALLALLFTLMHTGLLGAVLTFAREPLYGRGSSGLWDQQMAGLVMWIPGGTAYLAAAAWVVWRGLGSSGDYSLGTKIHSRA